MSSIARKIFFSDCCRPDPLPVDALLTCHVSPSSAGRSAPARSSTSAPSSDEPTSVVPSPTRKPLRNSSIASPRAFSVSSSSLPVDAIVDSTSVLRRRWSSSSVSNRRTSAIGTSSSLPLVPAQIDATWSSTGYGEYCACLSSSMRRAPRVSWARDAASRSDANIANASSDRNCARSSFSVPETFFIALTCAAPPTRDTEMPTSTAGRWSALNRSDCRKIWPSVMEMTLVGMYAETSLALVSMTGRPVIEPPPSSSESLAQRSSRRECR